MLGNHSCVAKGIKSNYFTLFLLLLKGAQFHLILKIHVLYTGCLQWFVCFMSNKKRDLNL